MSGVGGGGGGRARAASGTCPPSRLGHGEGGIRMCETQAGQPAVKTSSCVPVITRAPPKPPPRQVGAQLGGVVLWRERRRNALWGHRWLGFWQSRLGEWAMKLAGIGLGRVRAEPELLEPAPSVLPLAAERADAAPSDLDDLGDVVHVTELCVRRGRARLAASSVSRARAGRTPRPEELEFEQTLERQLAVLEGLLERFQSVDVGRPLRGVSRRISKRRGRCGRWWRG